MQSATAILSGNLPAEPNSFIGRERDLAELARLLGDVRVLTLSRTGTPDPPTSKKPGSSSWPTGTA
jgi:hypothetical protein